jgi:hypothetical protein
MRWLYLPHITHVLENAGEKNRRRIKAPAISFFLRWLPAKISRQCQS